MAKSKKKYSEITEQSQLSMVEIVQQCRFGFTLDRARDAAKELESYHMVLKYVVSLHDMDKVYDDKTHQPVLDENGNTIPREAHVHMYLKMPTNSNGGTSIRIGKVLEVINKWCPETHKYTTKDGEEVESACVTIQYCRYIRSGWEASVAYSIHANAPYKYQYSPDGVISNYSFMNDVNSYMEMMDNDNFENELMNGILAGSIRRYQISKMFEGREKFFPIFERKIDSYFRLRDMGEQKSEREVKVCFIHGKSGTGKTTFAVMDAERRRLSVCQASSGQNAMDDYNEEDAFILSEFRGNGWTQADLLMFLDNNCNAKVRARYHNRDFRYCKYIYICSSRSLDEIWESTDSFDNSEKRKQLARRIGTVIEMDKDMCYIYHRHDGEVYKVEQMKNPVSERFKDTPEDSNEMDFGAWGTSKTEFVQDGFVPIPDWFKDTAAYKQLTTNTLPTEGGKW